MKRILLACLLMAATTASHGQSPNDLAALPRASPEAAARLFSEAGYYMELLRRCGTPVDMALFTPLLRKLGGRQQDQLYAGMLAGQQRANSLGVFEYYPGSSECANATNGYNNAVASIQALMPVMQRR